MSDTIYQPGGRCGPFIVVSLVGCGGAAEVYQAVHAAMRQVVALKCLRLCHLSNTYIKEHMLAEAELLHGLRHHNVVHVEDVGIDKNILYMAMEFLSGMTLRALLKKARSLPPATALYYAREVADGLTAIHEMRVVHRDLKPENIMITEKNDVKVLDMGAAKFFGWDIKRTMTGTIFGTPLYMSPEHIEERPIDARSDVYSLGLILYEMLAGRHPFAKENGVVLGKYEICDRQLHVMPPPLSGIVAGLPEHVSDFIQRSIAKEKNQRPSSMTEFAQGVRAMLKAILAEGAALPSLPDISRTDLAPLPPLCGRDHENAGSVERPEEAAGGKRLDDEERARAAAEAWRAESIGYQAKVEQGASPAARSTEDGNDDDDDELPTMVFTRAGDGPLRPADGVLNTAAPYEHPGDDRAAPEHFYTSNGTEIMWSLRRPGAPESSSDRELRGAKRPRMMASQQGAMGAQPGSTNLQGAARPTTPCARGELLKAIPAGHSVAAIQFLSWDDGWIPSSPQFASALRRSRLLMETFRVLLASAMIALTLSLAYSRLLLPRPSGPLVPVPLPEVPAPHPIYPDDTPAPEKQGAQTPLSGEQSDGAPASHAARASANAKTTTGQRRCGDRRPCLNGVPFGVLGLAGPGGYPSVEPRKTSGSRTNRYSPKGI